MRCGYGKRKREAKYFQVWVGGKGLACATHDTSLGVSNLMDWFGLSRSEAAELNRKMDREWRAEMRASKYGVGETS